jgi:hypothetical protein
MWSTTLCWDISYVVVRHQTPLWMTFPRSDRPHKTGLRAPSRLQGICFDLLRCWKRKLQRRKGPMDQPVWGAWAVGVSFQLWLSAMETESTAPATLRVYVRGGVPGFDAAKLPPPPQPANPGAGAIKSPADCPPPAWFDFSPGRGSETAGQLKGFVVMERLTMARPPPI